MKKLFKKQELLDILWEDDEDSEIILDKQVDTSRWSAHHRFIFKKDGKLWETMYSRGLSESQDESPFEFAPDEIECVEVEEYIKVIEKKDYREV